MFTDRHADLIVELEQAGSHEWGPRALLACLRKLRDGGPTEWTQISVLNAWASAESFRVIYDWPGLRRIGIVRDRLTTIDHPDLNMAGPDHTPEEFGKAVADFNIAVPLGAYGAVLEEDAAGVRWWGHIPLYK